MNPNSRRPGFTLIELLVVFSIIAVLAALVAAGMMTWINSQSRRNTEAEIRTLHSALMQHWDAVASDAEKEPNLPAAVVTYAGGDAARARVIWVKLRLMEAFPVRFSEIQNFSSYAAPLDMIPTGRRRYRESFKKLIPSSGTQTKTESAACLLMALNVNHFGASHPSELFRPFTRDVDGDGLQEFVDQWGEPLYFYRFATGNSDLQGTATPNTRTAANKDPRDPTGKLLNWSGGNSGDFDAKFHTRVNGSEAWYAVPVIVAAGPDRTFGVNYSSSAPYQDMASNNATAALDDIYSFKVK